MCSYMYTQTYACMCVYSVGQTMQRMLQVSSKRCVQLSDLLQQKTEVPNRHVYIKSYIHTQIHMYAQRIKVPSRQITT